MSSITFYPMNLFETGSPYFTGSEDALYPVTRIYDRSIDLFHQETGTHEKTYQVDQGSSDNKIIDTLIIPKHNLNGILVKWEKSSDGVAWSDVVTAFTPSTYDLIFKAVTPFTSRYHRIVTASMVNPCLTEIFITLGYTFSIRHNPSPKVSDESIVDWSKSLGGSDRATKLGPKKKSAQYSILIKNSTLVASFDAMLEYLDGNSKPFFFKDHKGETWFARFANEVEKTLYSSTYYEISLEVKEI